MKNLKGLKATIEEPGKSLSFQDFQKAMDGIRNAPYHIPTMEERYGTANLKIIREELLPIVEETMEKNPDLARQILGAILGVPQIQITTD